MPHTMRNKLRLTNNPQGFGPATNTKPKGTNMTPLHLFPVNGICNFNRGNVAWDDAECQYQCHDVRLDNFSIDPAADDVEAIDCLIEYVIYGGAYYSRAQVVKMFGVAQMADAEARLAAMESGVNCGACERVLPDWEYTCVLALPEGMEPPLTVEHEWGYLAWYVRNHYAGQHHELGRRIRNGWIVTNFEREIEAMKPEVLK